MFFRLGTLVVAIVCCYLILVNSAEDVVAIEPTPEPGKAEGFLDDDLAVGSREPLALGHRLDVHAIGFRDFFVFDYLEVVTRVVLGVWIGEGFIVQG